jgi:hypothetical protein
MLWRTKRDTNSDASFTPRGAVRQRPAAASSLVTKSRRPSNARPVWDEDSRNLLYLGKVAKHLGQPASSQERIFQAFEEQDWAGVVYDPFVPDPDDPDYDAKEHLHQTIQNLNRRLRYIHFFGTGMGEAIGWDAKKRKRP